MTRRSESREVFVGEQEDLVSDRPVRKEVKVDKGWAEVMPGFCASVNSR